MRTSFSLPARRPRTPRDLVGLDIEPTAVTAAQVGRGDGGRLRVERSARVELSGGVVRDGEVADVPALTDSLRELYAAQKGLDRRVRIGVANAKTVMRVLELPPISDPRELEAAVRFQAADELPMPLDAAVLDFHALGVIETEAGPRQRVVLVAARRDMVAPILEAARAAGLKPEGLDLSGFAMVRALRAEVDADEGSVLFLSVGGLTNVALADAGEVSFTRVVGGGLEAMATDLAERRELTLEHARGWLGHVGLDQSEDTVDGDPEIVADARAVLEEGVRRIAAEVRTTIDFHFTQDGRGVAAVVLTGAAAGVDGFDAALATELDLPVRQGTVGDAPAATTVAAGLAVAA